MFCGIDEKRIEDSFPQENKKIQNYIYNIKNKVGQGNFSQVFEGMDQNTGNNVAIKVIKFSSLTTKIASQLLMNQVAILKELNNQYVIKCYDVFSSKNNYYIVTEYYEGGDLQRNLYLNKMYKEQDISKIIYEVYKGLVYLNQRNIVHRDLKPANIFLTADGTCKIADFGFAVKSSKPFKDISIGSPIYMSPQGLLLHQYGPKTEVWAFGIFVYQLLHGETPLSRCKDEKQLKQKILIPPLYRQGISAQLQKLIELCLTVDPKYRIQMKEISNIPYMAKLIKQFQIKSLKDLASTNHTSTTLTPSPIQFVQQVKVYEQGLALLQYCRLIHKTCQQTPSQVLSQWLLNICWNLQKINLQYGESQRNQNLLKTIHDYFNKYNKEHVNSHTDVSCVDIIIQCHRLIAKNQNLITTPAIKNKHNILVILLNQTQNLHKYGETNKLSLFCKTTQIQKYLDSLKSNKNSVQNNQFIFNK